MSFATPYGGWVQGPLSLLIWAASSQALSLNPYYVGLVLSLTSQASLAYPDFFLPSLRLGCLQPSYATTGAQHSLRHCMPKGCIHGAHNTLRIASWLLLLSKLSLVA